jgi:hypothetical protein
MPFCGGDDIKDMELLLMRGAVHLAGDIYAKFMYTEYYASLFISKEV